MPSVTGKPGRPPKQETDKFDYYIYVRMRADQYEKVRRIARAQGFAADGGMSAAVRWCVDRMSSLVEGKAKS